MKDNAKMIREIYKILPYIFIIIIYFFIINLSLDRDKKNQNRIDTIDSDLINAENDYRKSSESNPIESKRISIPVIPYR